MTCLTTPSSPHPMIHTWSFSKRWIKKGIIQLRVLPNVGMEGTAEYVFQKVNEMIKAQTDGRAWVKLVEVRENEKNSAIYQPE